MRKRMMKKNNKGFTLVELIIVVAVIAVLAAVLAPQYLQYVERSRESNDLQIATSIMRAATVAIADPGNDASATSYTIEWRTNVTDGTGFLAISDAGGTDSNNTHPGDSKVLGAIAKVMGWNHTDGATVTTTGTKAQSAAGGTADFRFNINSSTGAITVNGAEADKIWGSSGVGVDETFGTVTDI